MKHATVEFKKVDRIPNANRKEWGVWNNTVCAFIHSGMDIAQIQTEGYGPNEAYHGLAIAIMRKYSDCGVKVVKRGDDVYLKKENT